MMVSVETYLLRGKRQLDKMALHPGFRACGNVLLYCGGGFLISGARLWDSMQPFASGLVCSCGGIWTMVAGLGSMIGYQVFWRERGLLGAAWVLGAMLLGIAVHRWADREQRTELLTVGNAVLTAIAGLMFLLRMEDTTPTRVYLLQVLTAGGSACLFSVLRETQNRIAQWMAMSVGILALAGISSVPWLNPGCFAAGVLAAAAPLSAAALAGIGLEAAGLRGMTAGLCMSCFFRLAPVPDRWRRLLAPSLGCLTSMALGRYWDAGAWIGISLGGAVGAAIPWHWAALQHRNSTGALQVHLEQTARLFLQLQRLLLDGPEPPIDETEIVNQLRENACGECSCRSTCRDKDAICAAILTEPFSFACRKNGRILRELRRSQAQLRFLKGQRKRMGEYRGALVQQYGFLAGYLQLLADRLPLRERPADLRFHIQISSRSSSREIANGDRCLAFPGTGYRYYVLLCDGMGTGLGAAEESRQAAELLKQMLVAGLPPQYAMGNVSTHLALRGRSGAVTMDLAEIRLDSGRAAIYKWGAAPSLVVRRGRAEKIGTVTPPPGISVGEDRESVARLSLRRGEILILTSDGVEIPDASGLAGLAGITSPGELAAHILQEFGGSGEDDATAAVIRLRPVNLAT